MQVHTTTAAEKSTPPNAETCEPLRFLTCGSVDDGKSTLIGRLLHENSLVFVDHLAALERDSKKYGTTTGTLDFALLLDGLEAEREQGITIDVAYRYFSTKRRSFVVADAPGHEQYTRNMATGASNSDLAVLLADARKGLLSQTRRHAIIASLLGLQHVVLAVNKMDLVGLDEGVFKHIAEGFATFAADLGFRTLQAIPVSARDGDNISTLSTRMDWYGGPTLLSYLEEIEVDDHRAARPFRMPVQLVSRPDSDFRGFAGTVADGRVLVGDGVAVLPTGRTSRVKRILNVSGECEAAVAGDAVTLILTDEIDIARGDMLTAPQERAQVADQFAAHLVWMSDERLLPGRSYLVKINHGTVAGTVTALKHRIDVNTLGRMATKTLSLNDIGVCNISLARAVAFDAYSDNRDTGSFILIDRYTNETLAAGMIDFALRRAGNLHHQQLAVTTAQRSQLMQHKPLVLWFTGLPGAGKSTLANLVETGLHARGIHTTMLDGDNVRLGLNRDLGFTEPDRVENIRRVGEVARLMSEAGLVVLCSFISPFRAERRMVRELIGTEAFIEIFVDTPLDTCIARDPKGLYRRALAGEIKNVTGVDQIYEAPQAAALHLKADGTSPRSLADQVIACVMGRVLP
ncbi:sulfate adenylyltransferase subunit CysN [Bradyrhizobium sp. AUGA SZCCT0182]|uniref:sulfate adenylyltransferase subunit CysN n=1 Tax=Bradyrhizobium sp. AUGA SZCCT0182 TaxID=2807667 RepID=UPI001BA4F4BA|nr:sulfate adenylyltransferase subunit CysN [Bradyrhizobium sp. AUGA SZCCT0182]MBR1232030.1 sulfate adenylyltransferase subunit CysN [Bradyrhizobium sp. AUGA SZCCT0182]